MHMHALAANRNADLHERNMRIQAELDELNAEIEARRTQPPRLVRLETERNEHMSDLKKFSKFIEGVWA